MCGIVGFTSRNKSAVGPLVNGLRRLEYRGYDSAGVALESVEGIKVYKQTGKVAKLDNLLSRALPENERGKYTISIAHTRWRRTDSRPSPTRTRTSRTTARPRQLSRRKVRRPPSSCA